MKTRTAKTISNLIYLVAAALAVLACRIFLVPRPSGWRGGKIAEATGFLVLFSMAAEMFHWLVLTLLRSNKLPAPAQRRAARAARLLHTFHRSVGTLAVAALMLHFSLTADFSHAPDLRHLTGYLMCGLVTLSVAIGLARKANPKLMTKLHVAAAFAAALTLLVHLLAG